MRRVVGAVMGAAYLAGAVSFAGCSPIVESAGEGASLQVVPARGVSLSRRPGSDVRGSSAAQGHALIGEKWAEASQQWSDLYSAPMASDGNLETSWNAGAFAPQELVVDLSRVYDVSEIRRLVNQVPAGETTHEIYAGLSRDESQMRLLGTLSGHTWHGQWLTFSTSASGVRFIRIKTTRSPSWVSWNEIEVYGARVPLLPGVSAGSAGGATGVRKFDTTLFRYNDDPLPNRDVDVPMFTEWSNAPAQQPEGRSILHYTNWSNVLTENLAAEVTRLEQTYDLSRIDAIVIDEPFWNAINGDPRSGGKSTLNPCHDSAHPVRLDIAEEVQRRLVTFAQLLRERHPGIRFWMNLSEPESNWAQDAACPLIRADSGLPPINGAHLDVISVDIYNVDFEPSVRPHYDWFLANRPQGSSQQIALVPSVAYFAYGAGFNDPAATARILPQYFAYANQINERCDLPATNRAMRFDGCRVWMVAGWPSGSPSGCFGMTLGGATWYLPCQGVRAVDPVMAPIRDAWEAEVAKPRLDPMLGAVEALEAGGSTASGVVRGWAVDRKNRSAAVYVDLWIDGQYVATVLASSQRDDIASKYGAGGSGFTFEIPQRYRDGQIHNINVYAVAPTAETYNHVLLNPSSHRTFQFAGSNPYLCPSGGTCCEPGVDACSLCVPAGNLCP